MLSPLFEEFLKIYIDPFYEKSRIVPIRQIIRGSKKLNQLLFDNRTAIKEYYDELKNGDNFDYESAQKFFNTLQSAED